MDIEQMVSLLKRAAQLPHNTAADVFMTAGMMAEAVEAAAAIKPKEREHKTPVLTVVRLRELGLEYPSVAECAHDLVKNKGLTHEQAAKRMGATVRQVNAGLLNYGARNGAPAKKEG